VAESYFETFRRLVPRYLERPWEPADGIPSAVLDDLLAGHEFAVPLALREFYRAVGGCDELMEAENFFWDPDELEIDGDFLLFLDEENEAVNWGFQASALDEVDPIVWRRVNGETAEWSTEEAHFTLFVDDMFDWVFDDGGS
jgi:hypothetical protein